MLVSTRVVRRIAGRLLGAVAGGTLFFLGSAASGPPLDRPAGRPEPGTPGTPYPGMPAIAPIGVRIGKYMDVPEHAQGPAVDPAKGYRTQELGGVLHVLTENVCQSMLRSARAPTGTLVDVRSAPLPCGSRAREMKRIVLVDDDESVRRAMRSVLEREGYVVIEAENGAKALRLPDLGSARLVITDIVMPECEGTELIVRLRRELPELKVLALSGSPRAVAGQYLDIAGKLGASATLLKPVSPRLLLEAVRNLIGE